MNNKLTNLVEEALDFQRNHAGRESGAIIDARRRLEDAEHHIERNIQGVINYFEHLKKQISFGNGTVHMTPIEDMEKLAKHLQNPLAQFQNFSGE